MYQTDLEDFRKVMADLCTAFNRPLNDDLVRVYWEPLRVHPLSEIRQRARGAMGNLRKFPSPVDLKPEPEPAKPVSTYTPPPNFDNFHAFGQRCLLTFLQRAKHEVSPVQLRDLVEKKNRLVNDFRSMHAESEVTAEQMRAALFKAFERVAA